MARAIDVTALKGLQEELGDLIELCETIGDNFDSGITQLKSEGHEEKDIAHIVQVMLGAED